MLKLRNEKANLLKVIGCLAACAPYLDFWRGTSPFPGKTQETCTAE